MAHSTTTRRAAEGRPKKPRRDFPLFPRGNGSGCYRWCKKVKGKHHFFGSVADDPKGETALALWLDQKDDLLAGRTPRADKDGLSLHQLCNRFMAAKEQQWDAGDITKRSYGDYHVTCQRLLDAFGKTRLVDDLAADDFESLRSALAKRYGPHRLGNEVQRTRTIFRYGYDAGLIDRPMRFGPTFKKPSTRIMRAHRHANGLRMFNAAELRRIWKTAPMPLRAMVALGINAGYGNHDCGTLPLSAMDLQSRWVSYPRPKTSIERRCPLWKETVELLHEAIDLRPRAKHESAGELVFVTRCGQPWAKHQTTVTHEFRKLLDQLGIYRRGLGFYALRHTFQTIADEAKDPIATRFLMGHSDPSMSGLYREAISDDRLQAVVQHVHAWLWPDDAGKVVQHGE